MHTPESRRKAGRSKIANGSKSLLPTQDGRSLWARIRRDTYHAIVAMLGGPDMISETTSVVKPDGCARRQRAILGLGGSRRLPSTQRRLRQCSPKGLKAATRAGISRTFAGTPKCVPSVCAVTVNK
jgi:hypothetical protein